MNREFLETLFSETYEMAYKNSESALILEDKITEKEEILKGSGMNQIIDFEVNLQGLVVDKLENFLLGSVSIFKEIYGLDEYNKDQMMMALKNHSEKIIEDFMDDASIYEDNSKEFLDLKDKFRNKLKNEKRTVFKEWEILLEEREFLIMDLKFEVMLTISEFLYNVDRLGKIDFMIEKSL
jgi:hypothetical protein